MIKNIAFRWKTWGAGIFLVVGLCGCTQPFSKDVLAIVQRDRTFALVIEKPEAYIGSIVLWGGILDEVRHGSGQTMLFVIQNPLDAKGYPQTADTFGVFGAFTPRFLDPLIYRKGTLVTVAGEIDRVEERERGAQRFPCPILRVIEIHSWDQKPRGRF